MKKKQPYITIAIPIFNETVGVPALIDKTVKLPLQKEIIVIDDGSDQRTKKILKTIKYKYSAIRILMNKVNIGKTASIQKAIRLAKGRFFAVLDSDSELDPQDIVHLYQIAQKHNLRFVNGTRVMQKTCGLFSHLLSRSAKKIVSFAINLFYGKKIKDPLSGLKLFYTDDFKTYTFRSKKFGLETELITEAIQRGYPINEIDIHYYPRTYKEGKKIRFHDGLDVIYPIFWKKNIITITALAFIVWLISLSVYNLPSYPSPTTDTIPNIFTAVNIIYNRRLDLTNFKPYFEKREIVSYVSTENNRNQLFAKTPVINGILMVPFVFISDRRNGIEKVSIDDFLRADFESYYQMIGKNYGSFIASLSVVFIFLILYLLFHKIFLAFIWSLAYALGTSVYSAAAQGGWQHGPSLLLITSSYFCLLMFIKNRNRLLLFLTVFCLALATLIRISNAVFFISICIVFFFNRIERNYLIRILFQYIILILTWLIILNRMNIPGGYNKEIILSLRSISISHAVQVIESLLLSPNSGILIFSPIAIFGLMGLLKFVAGENGLRVTESATNILIISIFSFLGLFIFNSIWWAWEGGYAWGPRLLTEGWPFLIFFGAYFYQSLKKPLFKLLAIFIFLVLFFYSFFVQALGVYADETEWHSKYFKRDGSFTTAWTQPNIIDFYVKKRIIHTVKLIKKGDGLFIRMKEYRFELNRYKPLLLIHDVSEKIK